MVTTPHLRSRSFSEFTRNLDDYTLLTSPAGRCFDRVAVSGPCDGLSVRWLGRQRPTFTLSCKTEAAAASARMPACAAASLLQHRISLQQQADVTNSTLLRRLTQLLQGITITMPMVRATPHCPTDSMHERRSMPSK